MWWLYIDENSLIRLSMCAPGVSAAELSRRCHLQENNLSMPANVKFEITYADLCYFTLGE
jgi:hypothetical protein